MNSRQIEEAIIRALRQAAEAEEGRLRSGTLTKEMAQAAEREAEKQVPTQVPLPPAPPQVGIQKPEEYKIEMPQGGLEREFESPVEIDGVVVGTAKISVKLSR